MLEIFLGIVWYLVGLSSFIYWWTNELDFRLGPEFILAFGVAFLGPFAYALGWAIHGDTKDRPNDVIFKKRSK